MREKKCRNWNQEHTHIYVNTNCEKVQIQILFIHIKNSSSKNSSIFFSKNIGSMASLHII